MTDDIAEIKRLAGIVENEFTMASGETLQRFLADELDFLQRLSKVLTFGKLGHEQVRILNQIVSERLTAVQEQINAPPIEQKPDAARQAQAAGAYADTDAAELVSRSYGKV